MQNTRKKLAYQSGLNEKIKILGKETKDEIKILATKATVNTEQNKIVKVETHDLKYFLSKTFFRNDGSQNIFVYQLTFFTLELKVNKSTCCWLRIKTLYKSKLLSLNGALLSLLLSLK